MCVVLFLYLLLCRGKAIAPDITPPARLRRWAAALFGIMLLLMSCEYTDNDEMSTIAHLTGFPLAGLLLWRVETLKDLSTESLTSSSA